MPGPRETLYLAGKPIRSFLFWVPQSGRLGMGISIASYAGAARLGVATDAKLVGDPERIYFGAWVTLEDADGAEHRYRLVGPDEFDVARGWVSDESPIGRVLLGKREGDEVTVERPAGPAVYEVLRIEYEA